MMNHVHGKLQRGIASNPPVSFANGKDAIHQFGALSSALNYLFGGMYWKAIALIQFS